MMAEPGIGQLHRPEDAVVVLLEEILSFQSRIPQMRLVERHFAKQPAAIKQAIRRHWVVDHLPIYAMIAGIGLTDFERELADRFWAEVAREARENYRPRKRQEAASA